jgi:DNA-binding NarL/FixJ family response regulator
LSTPRILLADDHDLIANALRTMLEPRYNVLGIVGDGRALLESVSESQPDLVLVDIAMPLLNGLEAGRQLKARMPRIRVIYLTMFEDLEFAREAIAAGASGYLLKKSAASELFYAIDEVLRGRTYITPQISRGLEEAFIRDPRPRQPAKGLTPRQREVMQLLAEGKSFKEAAAILRVTPRTVAFHKYNLMQVLQLKTTADMVRFAVNEHMVGVLTT